MNISGFLDVPDHAEAIRQAVLQIQRDVAPEEMEVTSDYVDTLIEMAVRNELPSAGTPSEAGQFGAAEWMLLPIIFVVVGVLQNRLDTENAGDVADAEVRALIRRSGSLHARKLVAELTRSAQRAFAEHLAALLGPEQPAEVREVRHTDISCPRQIWKETPRFQVVVRLTLAPSPESAVQEKLAIEAGQVVHIGLQAPAFDILGPSNQETTIPSGQDSAPIVFDLRPRETGLHDLFLDFFQSTYPLGMIRVPVEVTEGATPDSSEKRPATLLTLESEVPHPDRTLHIVWDAERSSLVFTLIQGNWPEPFPPLSLPHDPKSMAAEFLRDLDVLTEGTDPTAKAMMGTQRDLSGLEMNRRLEKAGHAIWRFLPQELRSIYTRERENWKDGSLLICSDEPYLPWELVWPYGEGWKDEGPWCLTLRLSRWLRRSECGEGNPGAPGCLPLTALACIATEDLEAAQQERASLQELILQTGVRDVSPPELSWQAVMDLLESAGYDWLHVAAHGNFHAAAPEQHSAIWLGRGVALTPQHFAGPELESHLRHARPAFFFNACHAGRLGWSYTGLGGWAQRLIASGAGMFLGPLWAVDDEGALLMARSFYEHLRQGKTVAEAARQARMESRGNESATWLAYSLYAHPNAQIRLPDRWISQKPER